MPVHTIYLDNKIFQGMAGYQVITPLRIGKSSMHVLVNRGWAPANRDRNKLPEVPAPNGEVVVSGLATIATQKTWNCQRKLYRVKCGKILTLSVIGALQD